MYQPLPVSNEKPPTLKTYSTGKRVATPKPETWFGGWHVYGVTKLRFDAARAAHEAALAEPRSPGVIAPQWVKPKAARLTPKPYFLEDAMRQFVALQEQAGTTEIVIKKLLPKSKKK